MYKKRTLLNISLAIGIILLFFGMSVISTNGNIVEDKPFNTQVLDAVECSEELLFSGKTAYAYIAYSGGSGFPEGPCCFDLDNPGDIESLGPTSSGDFLTGGTWANGWGWLACEYNTGILWSINHTTGEMNPIAGGVETDIAWDDYTWKLYATNGFSFYTIDLETEEQELIGQVNISLMDIAFDNTGTLYGIGQNNDTYKLYTINISTFEASLIGPLVNFTSSWDLYIEFDKESNILYILSSNGLYNCDTETCECNFIGSTSGIDLTAFAIPYNLSNIPPLTTISFDPPDPDGENNWYISNVTVNLIATDFWSGIKATYYRINAEEWKKYVGPFVLSENGDDILIEFYSVDNDENVEDVKSETIDIDRTFPELTVEWEVTKLGYKKWQVTFFINSIDNTSGIDRLEFFINDVLIENISDPGSTYSLDYIIEGKSVLRFKFVIYNGAGNMAEVEVDRSDISSRTYSINLFTEPLDHLFRFLERFSILEIILKLIKVI